MSKQICDGLLYFEPAAAALISHLHSIPHGICKVHCEGFHSEKSSLDMAKLSY